MDEYIRKEAVLKHLNECKEDPLFDPDMARICFAISIFIEKMQAADVQPVKHGKWEYYKNNGIFDTHKCTLCGEKYEMYMDIEPTTIYKYCPNCGARMDGDTECQ